MNIKKIAAFSIGPIGSALIGLITLPILAWYYSMEDIGRIAMLQAVSSFCILVFSLGLDQAYVRNYHDTSQKSRLLKTALVPGLFSLTLMLCLCLLFPGLISLMLFSINDVILSVVIAACIIALFVSRFLSLVLRMQEKGLAFSMSQFLPKIIFLIVIVCFLLFTFDLDLESLLIAHSISIISVTIIYSWNTRVEWTSALNARIDTDELKGMLTYGAPLIMAGAAFWGLTTMDKVLLRSISSFEQLGIYSISVSFAAVASVLQSVFSTIWAPTVFKWASTGEDLDKVDSVSQYVLFVVLILFCLVGVFSWLVDIFLPSSYSSVKYVVVSCLGYPLLYTLSETTAVGINIAKKTSYSMLASIIAFCFNVAGNYYLIPVYGAAGAAVSTCLSFWIFFFLRAEFSIRLWRPFPRIKLYVSTLSVMFMASLTSLHGESLGYMLHLAWLLILMIVLLSFTSQVKGIFDWLKHVVLK
jgi:O-antigen/teichoic acid export membrane protein